MDLEGLGKAISEAIALRQLMASVEQKINETKSKIEANEKEIGRLSSLIDTTEELGVEEDNLAKEFDAHNIELQKRMEKLNKAGVELPLESPKGVVAL